MREVLLLSSKATKGIALRDLARFVEDESGAD
jgi:hypothetical protein